MKYTLELFEAGYRGSEKIILEHADMNSVIREYYKARRKYLANSEEELAYATIYAEDGGRRKTLYEAYFADPCLEMWELRALLYATLAADTMPWV